MFEELANVTLTHDINEHNLSKGDMGTVVHIYGNGEAYEVEFTNSNGETIYVLTLTPSDLASVEVYATNTWVEPVWDGLEKSPVTRQDSREIETRMFYSQL